MSPPPLLSYADLAKKAQNIKSPIAIDRRSSTVSPISVPSILASSSSSEVPSSSVHLASASVSASSSKSIPIGFSSKSSSTTSTTISVSSSSSVSSATASTTENSSVIIDGDADVEAEIDREGEFNRDRNGSDGKEKEKPPPVVNVWQMRFSRMAEVATAKLNGKGPSSSHLDNDHDAVSDEDDDPFVVKPRAQRGEIRQDSNRDSWPQPRQVSLTPGKGKEPESHLQPSTPSKLKSSKSRWVAIPPEELFAAPLKDAGASRRHSTSNANGGKAKSRPNPTLITSNPMSTSDLNPNSRKTTRERERTRSVINTPPPNSTNTGANTITNPPLNSRDSPNSSLSPPALRPAPSGSSSSLIPIPTISSGASSAPAPVLHMAVSTSTSVYSSDHPTHIPSSSVSNSPVLVSMSVLPHSSPPHTLSPRSSSPSSPLSSSWPTLSQSKKLSVFPVQVQIQQQQMQEQEQREQRERKLQQELEPKLDEHNRQREQERGAQGRRQAGREQEEETIKRLHQVKEQEQEQEHEKREEEPALTSRESISIALPVTVLPTLTQSVSALISISPLNSTDADDNAYANDIIIPPSSASSSPTSPAPQAQIETDIPCTGVSSPHNNADPATNLYPNNSDSYSYIPSSTSYPITAPDPYSHINSYPAQNANPESDPESNSSDLMNHNVNRPPTSLSVLYANAPEFIPSSHLHHTSNGVSPTVQMPMQTHVGGAVDLGWYAQGYAQGYGYGQTPSTEHGYGYAQASSTESGYGYGSHGYGYGSYGYGYEYGQANVNGYYTEAEAGSEAVSSVSIPLQQLLVNAEDQGEDEALVGMATQTDRSTRVVFGSLDHLDSREGGMYPGEGGFGVGLGSREESSRLRLKRSDNGRPRPRRAGKDTQNERWRQRWSGLGSVMMVYESEVVDLTLHEGEPVKGMASRILLTLQGTGTEREWTFGRFAEKTNHTSTQFVQSVPFTTLTPTSIPNPNSNLPPHSQSVPIPLVPIQSPAVPAQASATSLSASDSFIPRLYTDLDYHMNAPYQQSDSDVNSTGAEVAENRIGVESDRNGNENADAENEWQVRDFGYGFGRSSASASSVNGSGSVSGSPVERRRDANPGRPSGFAPSAPHSFYATTNGNGSADTRLNGAGRFGYKAEQRWADGGSGLNTNTNGNFPMYTYSYNNPYVGYGERGGDRDRDRYGGRAVYGDRDRYADRGGYRRGGRGGFGNGRGVRGYGYKRGGVYGSYGYAGYDRDRDKESNPKGPSGVSSSSSSSSSHRQQPLTPPPHGAQYNRSQEQQQNQYHEQQQQSEDSPFILTPPPQFQPIPLPPVDRGRDRGRENGNGLHTYIPLPEPVPVSSGYAGYVYGNAYAASESASSPVDPTSKSATQFDLDSIIHADTNAANRLGGAGGPPAPAPISRLSCALDPTVYYLLGQLEYYLSPQNMAQDFFLRQKMDSNGWVPIPLLASFNRIRQITTDESFVRDVLNLSTVVEVKYQQGIDTDTDKTSGFVGMVRMKDRGDWERFVLPDACAQTDHVEDGNKDGAENGDSHPRHNHHTRAHSDDPLAQGHGHSRSITLNEFELEFPNMNLTPGSINFNEFEFPTRTMNLDAVGAGDNNAKVRSFVEEAVMRHVHADGGDILGEPVSVQDGGQVDEDEDDYEEEEEEEDIVFVMGQESGVWTPDRS